MIALAAPLTLAATEGNWFVQKCHGKTCGPMAVFAVLLMLGVLCGGVFMLLQSNFGLLQGYLISGTAFWASWLVLAIIWFTGVPGVELSKLQAFKKDIPTSTPRYSGPQGTAPSWLPVTEVERGRLDGSPDFIAAAGTRDQDALKSAETAATEEIAKYYAQQLGVDAAQITVPGTVVIDPNSTEIVRSGSGASQIKYVKFATKAATAGPTATEQERALIGKVQPASFIVKQEKGTLAWPTYIALPLTFLLFLLHLLGLMWFERRNRPVPATTARERERATASA